MLLGHYIFPRAFENNHGFCKILGADKVYFGEFKNTEFNQQGIPSANLAFIKVRQSKIQQKWSHMQSSD